MKSKLTTTLICFVLLAIVLHVTLAPVMGRFRFSVIEIERWTPPLRRAGSPTATGAITCYGYENYEQCSINGPALLDPVRARFLSMDVANLNLTSPFSMIKTRPYPRLKDKTAMSRVKEVTLSTALPDVCRCGVTHDTPALVFSTGGYTGNFFHDFMDGFIPLYITLNSLFPDHHQDDVILVITDYKNWWGRKYKELLTHFSRHPIIDMDKETITHCFPSLAVGLIKHEPMMVDPKLLPNSKTLLDFQAIVEKAYSPDHDETSSSSRRPVPRPRLVLVNRNAKDGRMILNLEQVKKTAMEVGFDVTIFEPTGNISLAESFKLIHKSHAMFGVHGAALTHFLFLRRGSVLMQVVPIGTQWLADTYFRDPARVLGLEYLEYKIEREESTLAEIYGANDTVLTNPRAFTKGRWEFMGVYLKTQNVEFDMVKLKRYFRDAYKKAKKFMDKQS